MSSTHVPPDSALTAITREALVFTHLSSLLSYADTRSRGETSALVERLLDTIRPWSGLIVVIDQGWEEAQDQEPARGVFRALAAHTTGKVVFTFSFDEDEDAWEAEMPRLATLLRPLLRQMAINQLRLGGVYATHTDSWGCVNEVANALTRLLGPDGIVCLRDDALCGFGDGTCNGAE